MLREGLPVLFDEADFDREFNFLKLDDAVEAVCAQAIQQRVSFYVFMQRYIHFNGYAGSLVARLASSLGLSRDLFKDPSCPVTDEADRGLEIAAKVLAATIDEHADAGAQNTSHRRLAQGTLKAVGDYAKLSFSERNQLGSIPTWLSEIVQMTAQAYQGVPGDIEALIKALGFHAASECLADREYKTIDKVVRFNHQKTGFDAYLRTVDGNVMLDGHNHNAWYWVVIHGNYNHPGVEAEHFQLALEALRLACRYRTEDPSQIQEWVLQGFANFVEIQQRLFQKIDQDCSNLLPVSTYRPMLSMATIK